MCHVLEIWLLQLDCNNSLVRLNQFPRKTRWKCLLSLTWRKCRHTLIPEVKRLLCLSYYFFVLLVLGGHSVNQLLLVSTYWSSTLRVLRVFCSNLLDVNTIYCNAMGLSVPDPGCLLWEFRYQKYEWETPRRASSEHLNHVLAWYCILGFLNSSIFLGGVEWVSWYDLLKLLGHKKAVGFCRVVFI